MKREIYEEQLEFHEKKTFKDAADALFDAAYLLGMLAKESSFEGDEQIHDKLISLSAHYSHKINKDIREGKIAQEQLKRLRDKIRSL